MKIFIFALGCVTVAASAARGQSSSSAYVEAGSPRYDVPALGKREAASHNADSKLNVTVSKSIVLEHGEGVRRLSISNPEIAEAVAVSSTELLLNGKSAGDTTLLVWDTTGKRLNFDVHVTSSTAKVDLVRDELLREAGPGVSLSIEEGNVFLRGTADDQVAADRAANIAATLGKVVNLMRVVVPPGLPQVLLKVRFANVSHSATSQLGFNLMSFNQKGLSYTSTGALGSPPAFASGSQSSNVTFNDLLNIFYFRPDIDLGAVIHALEAKSLAQTLAEPNLLTVSGQSASFLAGGEFPFPTIQGGASGVGQITVQFKEYGIRLSFLPVVTPRGTIDMTVTPEVSSLDYSNGLTVNGFTVPGLATRRVQTEVELENGQSFVIAGLLNNEVTQQLDKIPGIGNIPVLGKLFQSRTLSKSTDELLVLVTPELVRPIPGGVKPPDVAMPVPFLKEGAHAAPQTPGTQVTGPGLPLSKPYSLPIEELKNSGQSRNSKSTDSSTLPPLMVVRPVQTTPDSSAGSPASSSPPPNSVGPNTPGPVH